MKKMGESKSRGNRLSVESAGISGNWALDFNLLMVITCKNSTIVTQRFQQV